jgi:hypothetical protein
MGKIADTRRTARGFAALRERYIRRSEFLCSDLEYLETLSNVRSEWQQHFPMYGLDKPLHNRPGVFPWRRLEESVDTLDPHERIERLGWQHAHAEGWWAEALWNLEFQFFPPDDFYSTSLPHRRPAVPFLQESIARDPRLLIGDTERFFPQEKLELSMDTTEYDALGIEPEEWEVYHPMQSWSIPVYPGMTADDLREAIPRIIGQIQEYLGPRTAGARIEALRNEGHTQQAIADRLGLNVKVVQAHLRTERNRQSENGGKTTNVATT